MSTHSRQTNWLFWPLVAFWRLITFIVGMTGRLLAVMLGMVLMITGAVLCATIIGAVIGIPLLLVGFMLALKGIF